MIKTHQREFPLTFGRDLLCLCFTPVVEIDVRAMNFENASLQ